MLLVSVNGYGVNGPDKRVRIYFLRTLFDGISIGGQFGTIVIDR